MSAFSPCRNCVANLKTSKILSDGAVCNNYILKQIAGSQFGLPLAEYEWADASSKA